MYSDRMMMRFLCTSGGDLRGPPESLLLPQPQIRQRSRQSCWISLRFSSSTSLIVPALSVAPYFDTDIFRLDIRLEPVTGETAPGSRMSSSRYATNSSKSASTVPDASLSIFANSVSGSADTCMDFIRAATSALSSVPSPLVSIFEKIWI